MPDRTEPSRASGEAPARDFGGGTGSWHEALTTTTLVRDLSTVIFMAGHPPGKTITESPVLGLNAVSSLPVAPAGAVGHSFRNESRLTRRLLLAETVQ